jgi:hypothetical protein
MMMMVIGEVRKKDECNIKPQGGSSYSKEDT